MQKSMLKPRTLKNKIHGQDAPEIKRSLSDFSGGLSRGQM
jgi:hypothetical protein